MFTCSVSTHCPAEDKCSDETGRNEMTTARVLRRPRLRRTTATEIHHCGSEKPRFALNCMIFETRCDAATLCVP